MIVLSLYLISNSPSTVVKQFKYSLELFQRVRKPDIFEAETVFERTVWLQNGGEAMLFVIRRFSASGRQITLVSWIFMFFEFYYLVNFLTFVL